MNDHILAYPPEKYNSFSGEVTQFLNKFQSGQFSGFWRINFCEICHELFWLKTCIRGPIVVYYCRMDTNMSEIQDKK
jgi:hypothetical protein